MYLEAKPSWYFRMPSGGGLCVAVDVLCCGCWCGPRVFFVGTVAVLFFVARWGSGVQKHVRRANNVGWHVCVFGVWEEAHVWRMKRRMCDCRRF
jgi:hypothetical protein